MVLPIRSSGLYAGLEVFIALVHPHFSKAVKLAALYSTIPSWCFVRSKLKMQNSTNDPFKLCLS